MSVAKKTLAIIISVTIVGILLYGVFAWSNSVAGGNRGGDAGLASIGARTFVTLAVIGGSAFITGFGLRDVIGRAVAARNRNRMKSQGSASH